MTLPAPGAAPSAGFITHVTRSQRALHAFILTMVWNAADADDVLQETNLVLWKKAAEYDETRPFMPWAARIAQYQSLAWLKSRQRSRLSFDDTLLATLGEEAAAESDAFEARRTALALCLQKLPEDQRALVASRYEPGGSVQALAASRGTSPKALSEMLRRIRHALQLCIEKNLPKEASS
jgi:RNA polymerase sigma-70 factor (ECF subfamily)